MFRVGLTGELGSGKSTVANLLAGYGAKVLSSDEMGRELMQPGQAVYRQIVAAFGPAVVGEDGQLDRPGLARLAFDPARPRIDELNAIVHPAVINEQEQRLREIDRMNPEALVVIESALIFTTRHAGAAGPWRRRFDQILMVTAPEEVKLARFLARSAGARELTADQAQRLRADALARLEAQRIPAEAARDCILIDNSGNQDALAHRTEEVFRHLRSEADHQGS